MNELTCKKCGGHDLFLRTIWTKDTFGNTCPIVLCQQCFQHAKNEDAVTALFGTLKKPPKNGDLINE